MSTKQRREYKIANQRRKARILTLAKTGDKTERAWWAHHIGLIQDGRHTR